MSKPDHDHPEFDEATHPGESAGRTDATGEPADHDTPDDADAELRLADDTAPEDTPAELDELDELRNRLLRTTADYQNFVKRSQANQNAAVEQRVISVVRDLVSVLDHFDRALQLDADRVSAADVMQGIGSVKGELMRVLGKYGVEPIAPEAGDPFDPNLHEALMRADADGVASNHVVAVLQSGYRLGDKPIRPAGVSVAP
jgi:molecular chaperone GrpE